MMIPKTVVVPFSGAGDSRAYSVVANTEVSIAVDAEPVATMIYEDPITRRRQEGVAVLREVDERSSDDDFWCGRVEFVDEPGTHYERKVYRR